MRTTSWPRGVGVLLAAAAVGGCGPGEEPCVPITGCCRTCFDEQACGDECIPAGTSCDRIAGCACDAARVCPGGGVPVSGSTHYSVCVGPRGTCSASCCIETTPREQSFDALASCAVHEAGADGYRVTFRLLDPSEQHGVEGANVVFSRDPSELRPVSSCESLVVRERSNRFEADGCTAEDVRPDDPFGGGCLLEMRLNPIGIVEGRLTCKEIALPSQELYLSTVGGRGVAPGTFELYGCELRL